MNRPAQHPLGEADAQPDAFSREAMNANPAASNSTKALSSKVAR